MARKKIEELLNEYYELEYLSYTMFCNGAPSIMEGDSILW
jgi:hypothetical protein